MSIDKRKGLYISFRPIRIYLQKNIDWRTILVFFRNLQMKFFDAGNE